MKKYIFVFILFIGVSSCQSEKDCCENYSKLAPVVCTPIELVEGYIKGNSTNVMTLEFAINQLESITGIISELDGTYIGGKAPSKNTYIRWKAWLEKHGIKCD